jgi:hypothetical protein
MPLTDFEADRLLKKTPELQRLFGQDLEKVKKHYLSFKNQAAKLYKTVSDDEIEKPYICARETKGYQDACGCNGVVHYGLAQDFFTNKDLDFETMRNWNFKSKVSTTSDNFVCNSVSFGEQDYWPGKSKNCWCEPKPIDNFPYKCADQGEQCMCSGDVYYVAGEINGNSNPKYLDVIK